MRDAYVRKEVGVECSTCLTIVPGLNRTGYENRLAGFRLPDVIGKEERDFKLGDFFSARLQFHTGVKHTSSEASDTTSTRTQLTFMEMTHYPFTGSWGKYFGSLGELSMAHDDVFELENAYVRAVYGHAKGWFEARAGIVWEGFGASNRPIGLSRPLIQKATAAGSPFFLWSLDQVGIEVGYYSRKPGQHSQLHCGIGFSGKKTVQAKQNQFKVVNERKKKMRQAITVKISRSCSINSYEMTLPLHCIITMGLCRFLIRVCPTFLLKTRSSELFFMQTFSLFEIV